MFTGIIQATGHVESVAAKGDDLEVSFYAPNLALDTVKEGDSIAVNGVCLTATQLKPAHFSAHVSQATLQATVGFETGQPVNLEKALRIGDYLGGHLVSGHVDDIGVVEHFEDLSIKNNGDCWLLAIRAPHDISQFIAQKGSICVDGVSLTVNSIANDLFTVNIIPHTLQNTTLNTLKAGVHVNLEIDQIARYVARMAEWAQESE